MPLLMGVLFFLLISCQEEKWSPLKDGVKDCNGNSFIRSKYPLSITNAGEADIRVILTFYPAFEKYYQRKINDIETLEGKEVLRYLPFLGTKESYKGRQLPDKMEFDFKDMKMSFVIHPEQTVILDKFFPKNIQYLTYFDDISIYTPKEKFYYGCNLYEQPFFLDCFKKRHFCNLEIE